MNSIKIGKIPHHRNQQKQKPSISHQSATVFGDIQAPSLDIVQYSTFEIVESRNPELKAIQESDIGEPLFYLIIGFVFLDDFCYQLLDFLPEFGVFFQTSHILGRASPNIFS